MVRASTEGFIDPADDVKRAEASDRDRDQLRARADRRNSRGRRGREVGDAGGFQEVTSIHGVYVGLKPVYEIKSDIAELKQFGNLSVPLS